PQRRHGPGGRPRPRPRPGPAPRRARRARAGRPPPPGRPGGPRRRHPPRPPPRPGQVHPRDPGRSSPLTDGPPAPEAVRVAAEALQPRLKERPVVALVLGSGLGGLADEGEDAPRGPAAQLAR